MTTEASTAPLLIRSPYLDISASANTGRGVIYNILSGKRYEVGEAVIDMLNYFERPASPDMLQQLMDFDQEQVAATLAFLRRKGLLLEPSNDGWEQFTTDVASVRHRLFGVAAYHEQAEVVLMGIPFGKGNSLSVGSAKFPSVLREYFADFNLSLKDESFGFFDPATAARLQHLFAGDRLVDWGNLFITSSESTAYLYAKLEQVAYRLFAAGKRPAFIGGDHSVSYPLIKAASRIYPDLHVIHFDAHTDTYSSRYDAVEHWGKVHHHGNFMSRCLTLDGVKQVYQFGIRGFANAFERSHDRQHIFWSHQISTKLREQRPFELPTDVPYYVTFDVDVLDPSVLPGTATPVANGLSMADITALLEQLLPNRQLIGFDLVEANPDCDRAHQTTQLSAEILLRLLSCLSIPEKP